MLLNFYRWVQKWGEMLFGKKGREESGLDPLWAAKFPANVNTGKQICTHLSCPEKVRTKK
jgi:hypothetical protein